jgi:hypothetical protein
MNTNIDYILEHLGSEATEKMVHEEFNGLTQPEVLEMLNGWFPGEENEKLAQAIVDYLA